VGSGAVAAAAGGLPDAPTSVSAVSGDAAATVSWAAPASDGGSSIIGYVVTPYKSGVPEPAQTFPSPALTDTVTGLTNGGRYTFRVAAYNANGTSPMSEFSAEMRVGTPGAPPSVSAVAASLSATVSWTAAVPNGAPITFYKVWIGQPGRYLGAQPAKFIDASLTTTTFSGLTAGQVYFFRVQAWNAYGPGPWTASSSITVLGGVPDAPTSVSAVPGDATATVTWIAPYDGGSPIDGYVITPYLSGEAQPAQTYQSDAVTETVTELTNGGSYTFTVAAFSASGTGSASAASPAIVVGTPSTPGVPVAVPGDSAATASWAAPASAGASSIIGYVVTPYNGGVPEPAQTFPSPALTETVTGLTNGGRYTFRVAAYNATGTGLMSGFSVELKVGAPGAPPSVSAVAASLSATVSWTAPVPNGAPITFYKVWVGQTGHFFGARPTVFVGPTLTATTVSELTAGQVYFFRVQAWNAYGPGPWTPSNSITVLP
jgi:predicted phage tail protein